MKFVLLSRRSVQTPPSPPCVLVGFTGCSFGDSAAVLVGLDEVSLAQLVLVQHSVGFLQNGARSQFLTGQDPSVFCNKSQSGRIILRPGEKFDGQKIKLTCVGHSQRRAGPYDGEGVVVGFQDHLFGGVRDWKTQRAG
jgi:hypothetical protein